MDAAGGPPDLVALYEKPLLKFERLIETYLAFAPRGLRSFAAAIPAWTKDKLFQKNLIAERLADIAPGVDWRERLVFTEHHESHAASAFYPSPFDRAAVLTLDGVGEWATASAGHGAGTSLAIDREIHFPHSLGLFYSAFTYYTGFKVNSGEYKLMGLAPYGRPCYRDVIYDNLLDVKPDGSFRLNLEYFNYCTGLTMTNGKFSALFGRPARKPEDPLEPLHTDVAASVQAVLNEVVVRLSRSLAIETGERNLCLAGGVALNCVANRHVLRDGGFDRIWIQPAAGDAGGALGAALSAYHRINGADSPIRRAGQDAMRGAQLGPEFPQQEIEDRLRAACAVFTVHSSAESLRDAAVDALADGKALGWFQGRMEFGPRALGARSILADPRRRDMQSTLNLKVKFRESFRPFAPAVPIEDAHEYFDLPVESPYMLLVGHVNESRRILPTPEQSSLFGIDLLRVPRYRGRRGHPI